MKDNVNGVIMLAITIAPSQESKTLLCFGSVAVDRCKKDSGMLSIILITENIKTKTILTAKLSAIRDKILASVRHQCLMTN